MKKNHLLYPKLVHRIKVLKKFNLKKKIENFFSLLIDVLINEKPDSRNVTELFNDIKSCALEGHFDFRQHGCKSCDTIRNQKLQKLYT